MMDQNNDGHISPNEFDEELNVHNFKSFRNLSISGFFSNKKKIVFLKLLSGSRLMWSLWSKSKLITLTR